MKHLSSGWILGRPWVSPSGHKTTSHGHKIYPQSDVHPNHVKGAGSKQTSVPGGPEGGVIVVQPTSPTTKSSEQIALDLLLHIDLISLHYGFHILYPEVFGSYSVTVNVPTLAPMFITCMPNGCLQYPKSRAPQSGAT